MNFKTYPVNLILKNRKVLIIGAGKVAARKVKLLLDKHCSISVIAPKVSEYIGQLAKTGILNLIKREFKESDLHEVDIVYIATGNKNLNVEIINICKKRRILCCAVDSNWIYGDFITPASIEKSGITVSVSSNGVACRKSRLIKNNIRRHIEMIERADLMVIGTDHNYMSLNERENFHLISENFSVRRELLSRVWGIHEYMILNTCNRIEMLGVVSPDKYLEILIKQIMGFSMVHTDRYYIKYGLDAFAHLAEVLSGIFSQTPGEKHIVSQVKNALRTAKENNHAESMLQEWVDSALHISKHVRELIEPLLGVPREIEDVLIRYLNFQYAGNLNSKRPMIIGTGNIGSSLVRKMMPLVKEIFWVYNSRKPEIKNKMRCHLISLTDFASYLSQTDFVVCAVTAEKPVITTEYISSVNLSRKLTFFDLGIPRNISPDITKNFPNTEIFNLDDLKYWYRRKIVCRDKLEKAASEVIKEHKHLYEKIIFAYQGKNVENRYEKQQTCTHSNPE